jgi:serine/threonine-protein kinase
VPAGAIVSQIPEAGMTAKPNSSISVTVSRGQNMATVPKDEGKQQSDAYTDLLTAGFVPDPQQKNDDNIPNNTIISMTPAGGTQAVVGSTVTYVYSIGPLITMKDIPNLVGATFDNGKTTNALLNAGLKMGKVTHSWNNTVPVGKIVSTSPVFGTQSPQDTAVNIVVSSGIEPINSYANGTNSIGDVLKSKYYDSFLSSGLIINITVSGTTTQTIKSVADENAFASGQYKDYVISLQSENVNTPEIDFTISQPSQPSQPSPPLPPADNKGGDKGK